MTSRVWGWLALAGMLVAGSIPLALYNQRQHLASLLAAASAGLFATGLALTLIGLTLLARHGHAGQPASKPASTTSTAAPSSAASSASFLVHKTPKS